MLRATVVLRSYNRLTASCEALEACLEQDYSNFEVLVVEQSTQFTPEERQRLEKLAEDERVILAYRPPLGGPGSRNEACGIATGDIIIMLDDDDVPAHSRWLSAFMNNFEDPNCLAVTGRHIYQADADPDAKPPYVNMEKARRQVLSYSFLKWQRCYTRLDSRSENIENIHGTNSAIRRSALERFGMWDTCTKIEDESSFCYRMLAGKRPDEYLVFDPEAGISRRLDIGGGLDKRQMSALGYGRRIFQFLHNITGHYHTARFVLLYPAYVYLLWYVTADWVWHESSAHQGRTGKKLLTIVSLGLAMPLLWTYWLARWSLARMRDGRPHRADKLPPRESLDEDAASHRRAAAAATNVAAAN